MRPISVVVLLAALASVACHTIKPVTLAELNTLKPDRAWLTESDQAVVVMQGPQVVGDTLVGYVNGKYEEIPVSQFKEVRVQKAATTRTVLLIGVLTAGFGGMVYSLIGSHGGDKYKGSDYCEEHGEDPDCGAGL